MRLSVLGVSQRDLARSVAVVLIGGMAAGCSSGTMRFSDGVDGIFTGSTSNQRSILKKVDQPYPGDSPVAAAPLDGTYTGSVNRGAVEPVSLSRDSVTRSKLAPVSANSNQVATAPRSVQGVATSSPVRTQPVPQVPAKQAASTAPRLDKTATGSVPPASVASARPAAGSGDAVGWSGTGGTQVTIKSGETVYNLSRRFGVPADVIMKVNGLSDASGLQAGQKVIIPTYVYSRKAPVSAPDSNPNVADAKSSRGTKYDVPADKVPVPPRVPVEKAAVLPQGPKVKDRASAAVSDTGNASAKSTAKGSYSVQSGDTLSAIAKRSGVSVAALKKANGLEDGLIRIGQQLTIPAGGSVQVAKAVPANIDPIITGTAGPAKKAQAEKVSGYTPPKKAEKVFEDAAKVAAVAPDSTGIGRMRWPARGRVISSFGGKTGSKANDGIDIAVPEGTPVKSAENGVVIYAGDGLKDFGNTILVRHEDGLVTVYGHASKLEVSRGDKVRRGQEIARSGMSGATDTPKLHFEVRKNSAPVDPAKYLE